jgi:eukaryotic-like serine/threonine-protein kinase
MNFPLGSPAPAVQPLEPTDPVQLGPYRLTGRLGQGGQALVYLGEAESGAPVAVKFFLAPFGDTPSVRESALRELEAAKQVARFCTAQVLDSGTIGTRPYIVSEYVPGPSLQYVVTTTGPYSGSVLDRLAIGTATALVALHDAGIVHRDFKPSNVLIGPDGPRVIDFGIARVLAGTHTLASQVVGTPAYMAPEQLAPGELGPAMDVFAWASTMVFAVTGRPPFGSEAVPAVMNRIAHLPPELDGIEEPLRGLLAECLAKDPVNRPSAQQVLDRLVRRSGQAPPEGAPATGLSEASGPATGDGDGTTSRRGVWAAAAGLVCVLGALCAGVLWLLPEATAKHSAGPPAGQKSFVATESQSKPNEEAGISSTGTASASAKPASSTSPAPPQKPAPGRTTGPGPQTKPSTDAPTPQHRVELGEGHFTGYCQTLGWEWVEYRESPQPGAYCVMRKGQTMYLTSKKLDAGCQWRFNNPRARHYFKNKTNFCYAYQ